MSNLLLVACSARKRAEPTNPVPALERYDGVLFRVVRKWLRQTPSAPPDVLIISAKFGLIDSTMPIPDYDQRMTVKRATELSPQVRGGLRSILARHTYQSIFVNMGRDYLVTVAEITELSIATWAYGGIGQRAQQLKAWLEALPRQ